MNSIIFTAAIGLVFVVGLVLLIVLFNFFGIWLRAKVADAPVSFAQLVGMRLRRVPVGMIVDSRITAVKAGIPQGADELEA
ncbi:MAG: flotillin-like FloA family protein, partial [Chthoniobacterales bacterium]